MSFRPSENFRLQCQRLQLNPERILLHAERVSKCLASGDLNYLKISDTCRIDNGGIIPFKNCEKLPARTDGVVSFIPAAGASSRYMEVFSLLAAAIAAKDLHAAKSAIADLQHQNAQQWNLPGHLAAVLNGELEIAKADLHQLHLELTQPKAFFPCVKEGLNFLEMKIKEDEAFGFLVGRSFVTNPKFLDPFDRNVKALNGKIPSVLQMQGPEQSTIRFKTNGEPYIEGSGEFSLVPAGHGTLSRLLPELAQAFPQARSALIRNIDNIIGTSAQTISYVRAVVSYHNFILDGVQKIRVALKAGDTRHARLVASDVLSTFPASHSSKSHDDPLWDLQAKLFYSDRRTVRVLSSKELTDPEALLLLYLRPVNTLGQVPNTQRDVGGTPSFIEQGEVRYKMCLELPHASPQDQQAYLVDPTKATHFNPVFVLAELDFKPDHYENREQSSWILSKKKYLGETVYYHESVLYELLGNSLLANANFLEIPRTLFHPHKSLEDSRGRHLREWLI